MVINVNTVMSLNLSLFYSMYSKSDHHPLKHSFIIYIFFNYAAASTAAFLSGNLIFYMGCSVRFPCRADHLMEITPGPGIVP